MSHSLHPLRRRAKHQARNTLRRNRRKALLASALLSLGAWSGVWAQTAAPRAGSASVRGSGESAAERSARWQESFDGFAAADRAHAPQPGGVLFVGSSSIRMWDGLEQDFNALPVIVKRGFGGSRLSDCADHVATLVLPYRPRVVIVYAGDNDLAEGATPADVLASFERFVRLVRRDLPGTRIAYLSIKPSPLRAALMEKVQATNALIADHVGSDASLDYIDVYGKMLAADGRPRPELFAADMLHLNRAGYALWRTEITRHLGDVMAPGRATASVPRAAP